MPTWKKKNALKNSFSVLKVVFFLLNLTDEWDESDVKGIINKERQLNWTISIISCPIKSVVEFGDLVTAK